MRDIWFCKFCFRQQYIEHDGINGSCLGCGTRVVKRQAPNDIFNETWFPVVEVLIGVASPIGGAALKSLERMDESASSDWKPLLNLAAGLVIAVVAGVALEKLLR